MRITLTASFSGIFFYSFCQTAFLKSAVPGREQPEYFLSRVEREGWKEILSERKEFSSVFELGNRRLAYSSAVKINYYDSTGTLVPVDIRPSASSEGWFALSQPSPVRIFSDGTFAVGPENIRYSRTIEINGTPVGPVPAGRQDGQSVFFDEVVPGVTKQLTAGHGSVKYNYIIHEPPALTGSKWSVSEKVLLAPGARTEKNKNYSADTPAIIFYDAEGKISGGIFPVVCYDADGAVITGNLDLQKESDETTILEISVPGSWLLSPERSYPVIVDPLVTGPTTTWTGGNFPSCFFPNYYSDAAINVTIPAGITVTALKVTANFYANPFTTTVMGDGRMYFSTNCGQTQIFQVTGPMASQPGTGYLEEFDMRNPLLCCIPQSCSTGTVQLRMHLSRTSNGTACNTTFLYYDAASPWPFRAYVEGYTPEAYSSEMNFQPAAICGDECEVNARIFARYGVPPFTFTHPWATAQVDTGTAIGCSAGNTVAIVPLAIPDCPNFCDPATALQVPAPVVTDACGASVSLYDPFYSLTVRPVPQLTPFQDTVIICSEQELQIGWESCLPGTSVSWYGNGQQGTGFTHSEVIANSSNAPQPYAYIATPALNGCGGPDSEIYVWVYPFANTGFTFEPETVAVFNTVAFSDQTVLNGNSATGWEWNFGDGQTSDQQNPQHTYSAPGTYQVCLSVLTEFGCTQQFCDTVTVIPAELELPNIVTPNDDGVNDLLHVKYLEFYPDNQIKVYNRWGNIVFEKKNYANDWSPKNVSDGVYFYVVSVDGGKEYSQILHVTK